MKPTISIIERNDALRSALTDILIENGFDVQPFFSPTTFLTISKDNPPDLVISGIRLNEIPGLKLLEIIGKNFPSTKCIIISGLYDHTTGNMVKRLGGVDFIQKPFDTATLLFSIKKALIATDLA